jgi:hypothetical protein
MVFFVWTGGGSPHEAVNDDGEGLRKFGDWTSMSEPYNGLVFGVFPNATVEARSAIDEFHGQIHLLPGVNGRLNAEQANIVKPAYAGAQAGTPMYDILSAVFAATGAATLDPDSY